MQYLPSSYPCYVSQCKDVRNLERKAAVGLLASFHLPITKKVQEARYIRNLKEKENSYVQ
jgi:hypothetical protein